MTLSAQLYKILDAVGFHPGGAWRELGQIGPRSSFDTIPPQFQAVHETAVTRFHQKPKGKTDHCPHTFVQMLAAMKAAIKKVID